MGTVIALIAAVAACAQTKTTSNRSTSYAGDPKRMFVFEAFIKSRYLDPADFDRRLVQHLSACGVAAETRLVTSQSVNSLALDDDEDKNRREAVEQIRRFAPDTTLTVVETSARQGALTERIERAQFAVTLRDIATKKNVWKAQINLTGGMSNSTTNNLGYAVADAVAARLSQDGVLHACPAAVTNAAKPG